MKEQGGETRPGTKDKSGLCANDKPLLMDVSLMMLIIVSLFQPLQPFFLSLLFWQPSFDIGRKTAFPFNYYLQQKIITAT